ncbi:MAG: ABC transporter permease [Gemmatimonadales bacterium]|nr:ABC transporter permease [Gemmatimonadales bacterium]
MSDLLRDLRYALRSLLKSPGFALITVVTLALGIGANTAIFSVVNAVLLRPLPFREPERLILVRETYSGGLVGSVSGPNFLDWQSRGRSFEGMAASRGTALAMVGEGEPEEVRGALVSADFFRVLGVELLLGRGFAAGEDRGEPSVAVIGERIWRDRYGAAPDVVGRTIRLSGRAYAIVGVTPDGMNYPGRRDVWLPFGFGTGQDTARGSHSYDVLGRLKPGVDIEEARNDLATVARALATEYPETNTGRGIVTIPLGEDTTGPARPALLVLSGAVALVLLIACANVANLFLARAVGRQREIAVRAALGAGRWRLARQVMAEAAALTTAGCMVGIVLAGWAVDLLVALAPAGIPRVEAVGIDGTVLAYAIVISTIVGMAFGVIPALYVAGQDPADSFRGESRTASGSKRRSRLRTVLVVAQISLALVLLVGATLLIVTVRRLGAVDPGFRPEGVTSFQLGLTSAKRADATTQRAFLARVIERLEAIPGVWHAGAVFFLPLGSGQVNGDFSVEGQPPAAPGQEQFADYRLVAGDYPRTVGVSLVGGRFLEQSDGAGAAPVVLVNQALVRKYFGGENPLGRRITFGSPDSTSVWREVVGVVGDVRHLGLTADPVPEIYTPIRQLAPDDWANFAEIPISFAVRSETPFARLAPEIRRAVREVDPEQPISRLREATELLSDALARQRFSRLLLVLFGGLALTLAAIGVYGVMAHAVSQRTRELGIRLALGAHRGSVRALVLRQGLGIALLGIGLGLAGALALGRLLTSLLYQVSPADPLVLAAAALTLSGVSALACLVPAIRATRVDPMDALRSE